MIRSERGSVEIRGTLHEIAAEFGMLTKHIIISVPEEHKMKVALLLTEEFRTGILLATKGGEENEESQ